MNIRTANMRDHLIIILSLVAATTAESFADWMTKDFCNRRLAVGEVIMNNLVEASDERFIRVFRGEEQLTSGSIYHHSESLTVSISDAHNQFVYEAIGGAIFDRGGCDGKRVANKPQAILKMPTSGDETISIVAGWATSHEAVSLSPNFILVAESWTDRREDLVPKVGIAETHEEKHAAVADQHQEAPKKEIDNRLGASDSVGRTGGDLAWNEKGGQLDPEDHRRVIPEPQENLFAHELHKDERNGNTLLNQHIQHDTYNHDHADHESSENEHDHENDEHDHHGEVEHPYHEEHDHEQDYHEQEHNTDHHELSLRDDPQAHLSHSDLTPRVAKKDEPHVLDSVDNMDRNKDHRIHLMRNRDPLDSHGNRFADFRRDREKFHEDLKRENDREGDPKHDEKDITHPHSLHIKDHDVFDLARKQAMDKIRDRDLFQGRLDESSTQKDTDAIHRKAKSQRALMKERPKRALRGASYTDYVRTHTVLVGECILGGLVVIYLGYRIYARYRFKVHRYINKVKGLEEK